MTILPTPAEAADRLEAAGETDAAALIRAMAVELATVRAERDGLAAFTRSVSISGGSSSIDSSRLAVRAMKVLDTLRVTERCPKREGGQHRWMRRDDVFGSRCFSCNARRPGT
jgi:hypothetical protein